MAPYCAAGPARARFPFAWPLATVALLLVLGGCGPRQDFSAVEASIAAMPSAPAVPSRGAPVPPPVAQVLEAAPPGARLDYRPPDGGPIALVLGAPYQSGLLVPCRLGRLGAAGPGSRPVAYVFCRQDQQWFAMPPVVVSGL